MKINLITSDGKPWYADRLPNYPDIIFYENCYEDILWDVVAYFEDSVVKEASFETKHTLLLSGEPPHAVVYPRGYLRQFEKVLSCNHLIKHPNIILEQPTEPIHIGRSWKTGLTTMSYRDLETLQKPEHLKVISLMSSTLNELPGHHVRMALVEEITKQNKPIDIFGRGRKYVDDKIDAILPYMFHVCIENAVLENYWTEKIADPLVCKSVPIYYGCPNIDKFFDTRCMFITHNLEEITSVIDYILSDPVNIYNEKLPYLLEERKKVFSKYNIIETIKSCEFDLLEDYRHVCIHSKQTFTTYDYLFYKNKLNNKLKKILSKV